MKNEYLYLILFIFFKALNDLESLVLKDFNFLWTIKFRRNLLISVWLALSLVYDNSIVFQQLFFLYLCNKKILRRESMTTVFAVRMSKNTTEAFYDKTLRINFCVFVVGLEPVLLITTAGTFKRFKSTLEMI